MSDKRKKLRFGPIEEDIMQHLTASDFLFSVLLSSRSSRTFYKEAQKRARARYAYMRSLEGLKKSGILRIQGDLLMLTKKGQELMDILDARGRTPDRIWTGRWWIIMYDIPVSMNSFRFELRGILIRSGFRKLQQSVWIHFQPCKELEMFLTQNPSMSKCIRYFEALPFAHMETIEDWKRLSSS